VGYGKRLSYAISPPVMAQSSSKCLQIMFEGEHMLFKSFEVFEVEHQHARLFQIIALMDATVSAAMLLRSTLMALLASNTSKTATYVLEVCCTLAVSSKFATSLTQF